MNRFKRRIIIYFGCIIIRQTDRSRGQIGVGYRRVQFVHVFKTISCSHDNSHPRTPIKMFKLFNCNNRHRIID
ncbi:hypothetical protein HanPI659440_Chr03g0109721 [Helianthus annuus]|nr:hypothetical protein HanPI659440_Chr03g0109721 [Helianthus annuus]